jgi:hypothetical protein
MKTRFGPDRYAVANADLFSVGGPHSGPGRAGRARQILPASHGRGAPVIGISWASPWLVLSILLISISASAQTSANMGTYTEGVTRGARRQYSFTTSGPGQLTATLSWDNQPADLYMLLVCTTPNSTTEPLTFGVAGGQLDRTARLESGILGRMTCLLGVATFDEPASFRLNILLSSNQLASPAAAPLIVASPRDPATEARLLAHVAAAAGALEASRR